jgi:nitroreductase
MGEYRPPRSDRRAFDIRPKDPQAMTPVTAETLIRQLSWRYATKKFDPSRKISAEIWAALEAAMMLAPSSYGLQPWKFVVVSDPAVRAALREHSWNQPQITDASHVVVLARRSELTPSDVERWIDRIVEVRKTSREGLNGYRDMMLGSVADPAGVPGGSFDIWISRQVYIALGFFLSSAAMLGVDACPMEGFDPGKYDEILDLPASGYRATVVAAAGYRSADDHLAPEKVPKVRYLPTDVIIRR